MDLLGFRAVRVHGHERLVVAQADMQNLFVDSDSEMSLLLVRGGLTDFGRRPVWHCRAERVPCGHTEAELEDLYDTLNVHLGVGTAKGRASAVRLGERGSFLHRLGRGDQRHGRGRNFCVL